MSGKHLEAIPLEISSGFAILTSTIMFRFGKRATLYLHFPCFDGTISAVLAALFLQQTRGWNFRTFRPVNYNLQNQWLDTGLARRSAVVDFLYHPQAKFWADHHSTAFLTEQLRADYEQHSNSDLIYEEQSGSCASLLWRRIPLFHGDKRLEEMVLWAEKIDSAAYESVQEALSSSHPALVLNNSLAINADEQYCSFLVRQLQCLSLSEIAETYEVRHRFAQAADLSKAGLNRVKETIRMEGKVAVYDLGSEGTLVNRYAPYYFHPEALYSIAVSHSESGIRITAMRNPWIDFKSMNLGQFMRQFGGGGHNRVGSLILSRERESEANDLVSRLMRELVAHANLNVKTQLDSKV